MKKIIKLASFLSLSLGVMLFASSCSRSASDDDLAVIAGKQQSVTFNVSTFGTSVNTMGIERQSVKPASEAGIRQYVYNVYQWSGTSFNSSPLVTNTITAPAGEDITGHISLNLYRGIYRLTLVALGESTGVTEGYSSLYYNTYLYGAQLNSDRFFNYADFEVIDAAVNSSITLNRVVGRMDVVLTARLPENAAYMKIETKTTPYMHTFLPAVSVSTTTSTITTVHSQIDALKTTDNGKLSVYFFGGAPATMSVTLRVFNASNVELANRVVSNVGIYNSQVTILKGKMFPESAGWDILVDDTPWDERTPIEF